MPLLPQIALQTQMPQVAPPDFARMLGLAEDIQSSRQQRMLRDLAYQQALQQRQQERDISAFLQGRGGMQSISTLADQVPPAAMATTAPSYAQRPQDVMSYQSAATQAPPGTTYQRAPAAMQPRPARQVPQAPVTSQELVQRFGTAALPAAEALAQMEQRDVTAQFNQGKLQEQRLRTQLQGLESLEQSLGLVTDQASLDALRAQFQQISPQLASVLPKAYNAAQLEMMRKQLVPYKDRVAQSRTGLEAVTLLDENNQPVLAQLTTGGAAQRTTLPEGTRYPGKVQVIDTPTEKIYVGAGGQELRREPKDIRGKAAQEAGGTVSGKREAEEPERREKAQSAMYQLRQKHALMKTNIDEAIKLAETSTLPTTGIVGSWLKNVYQPGTDLARTLDTVQANLGFEELSAMRQASPTGGALGQITERELAFLQSVQGSLAQNQSKDQFIANLKRIKKTLEDNEKERDSAFQRQFAQRAPSQQRPPSLEDVEAEIARRQRGSSAQ